MHSAFVNAVVNWRHLMEVAVVSGVVVVVVVVDVAAVVVVGVAAVVVVVVISSKFDGLDLISTKKAKLIAPLHQRILRSRI